MQRARHLEPWHRDPALLREALRAVGELAAAFVHTAGDVQTSVSAPLLKVTNFQWLDSETPLNR